MTNGLLPDVITSSMFSEIRGLIELDTLVVTMWEPWRGELQLWVATQAPLAVNVLLDSNILLCVFHITGEANVAANALLWSLFDVVQVQEPL